MKSRRASTSASLLRKNTPWNIVRPHKRIRVSVRVRVKFRGRGRGRVGETSVAQKRKSLGTDPESVARVRFRVRVSARIGIRNIHAILGLHNVRGGATDRGMGRRRSSST